MLDCRIVVVARCLRRREARGRRVAKCERALRKRRRRRWRTERLIFCLEKRCCPTLIFKWLLLGKLDRSFIIEIQTVLANKTRQT